MKLSKYLRAERRISTADGSAILERWRWGRQLLADPEAVNAAGTIRRGRGVVERLVEAARARRLPLSEREIQRRLQLARTYPTEELCRQALARYGTWEALAAAGFPALDDAGDDRQDHASGDQADQQGAPAEPWHQQPALDGDTGEVFPREIHIGGAVLDRDACSLRTLAVYLDRRERWTEGHLRRNAELRAHLDDLIAAVGGDVETPYGEAVAALDRAAS